MQPFAEHGFAWGRILGAALVLAVVCNGAGSFLKRTDIWERDAYLAYWAIHCANIVQDGPAQPVEPRCCAQNPPGAIVMPESPEQHALERAHRGYVYRVSGAEVLLKLAKDALVIGFIAISLLVIAANRTGWPAPRDAMHVDVLLAYALLAVVFAWVQHGGAIAAAGLRFFWILAIARVGAWFAPQLGRLAPYMAALLVIQIILVPVEAYWGLHLFHEYMEWFGLARRASGTLVLPNSLGVFAVVALAFYYSFSQSRRYFWTVSVVALLLVAASGSAMGWAGMLLLYAGVTIERSSAERRTLAVMAATVALAILFAALPLVTGRPDVHNSWLGRVETLEWIMSRQGLWSTLFGNGLGVGTDTAWNLVQVLGAGVIGGPQAIVERRPDSTVTALVVQLGLLGTFAFYALLVRAWVKDTAARMFYGIVILCSLSLNITELFPVNFLLGLVLARSKVPARLDFRRH